MPQDPSCPRQLYKRASCVLYSLSSRRTCRDRFRRRRAHPWGSWVCSNGRSCLERDQPGAARRQSQVWRSTAPQGARLSEAEFWGMPAAGGWSCGRRYVCLSSLCKSWVLIANILGAMVIIGVHGKVSIAINLYIRILVPSLPRHRLAP
jgi:hypothetical protein